jgi:broad specificity polyphosphatase/5'/3'-nucleotidase SurE
MKSNFKWTQSIRMKLRKQIQLKKTLVNRVNSSNLQFKSWIYDNLIQNKLKRNYKISISNKLNIKRWNSNWKKKHKLAEEEEENTILINRFFFFFENGTINSPPFYFLVFVNVNEIVIIGLSVKIISYPYL